MSGPMIKTTKGESLFLWRRRQGLSQPEAAAQFKVSVDTYREWEADQRTKDQPRQLLGGALKPHEVCVIKRRREKLTQREVGRRMGCTRLWVHQMEAGQGPVERLREFWGV